MSTALAVLIMPLMTWFLPVIRVVTEPYLDEEFHMRQAQHYCAGRFDTWDPKITTPPGLYLLSTILSPILGCDVFGLRVQNAVGLAGCLLVVTACYTCLRSERERGWSIQHSALNIVLFPPLFFFSALYYTDVASTLTVLLFYYAFLRLQRSKANQLLRNATSIILGVISVMFRQTNIFWVAIFPAGIVVVSELDKGHQAVKNSMTRRVEGFGDTMYSVAKISWKMEVIYDPPVRDAWFDDYLRTSVSLATCILKVISQPAHMSRLLTQLAPYITLLMAFTAFVVWNGGVVLGDKSNHIITLHLPQMLYIWPYTIFFSWSLLYPYLLLPGIAALAMLPKIRDLEGLLIFKRRRLLPSLSLSAMFISIACAVVYFNTIVHPFTLADNRHYTFYVFRLLLRLWWMKYAVAPIYILCGWACIQPLGGGPVRSATANSTMFQSKSGNQATASGRTGDLRLPSLPDGQYSATTSFALIWLATSALQLITAPLVEPRYFILPWIFWRIHLPVLGVQPQTSQRRGGWWQTLSENIDPRLMMETLWLLAINAATGYIFLNWGFGWPQEPGKVQRFMW